MDRREETSHGAVAMGEQMKTQGRRRAMLWHLAGEGKWDGTIASDSLPELPTPSPRVLLVLVTRLPDTQEPEVIDDHVTRRPVPLARAVGVRQAPVRAAGGHLSGQLSGKRLSGEDPEPEKGRCSQCLDSGCRNLPEDVVGTEAQGPQCLSQSHVCRRLAVP